MPDSIPSALTPEEWRAAGSARAIEVFEPGAVHVMAGRVDGRPGENALTLSLPDERHALAAACLAGQPFGFTWEDVDEIEENIRGIRGLYNEAGDSNALSSLRDRIAALLPPRQG